MQTSYAIISVKKSKNDILLLYDNKVPYKTSFHLFCLSNLSHTMAASSETPIVPPPVLPTEPVEYIGIRSFNPDGTSHLFIVNKAPMVRYSGTIGDLVKTTQEIEPDIKVEGGLSDDPQPQNINNIIVFELSSVDFQTMWYVVRFPFWKERWANVVTERIPDFPVPAAKEDALRALIVANDIRV